MPEPPNPPARDPTTRAAAPAANPQRTLPLDSADLAAMTRAGGSVRERLGSRGRAAADVRLGSRPSRGARAPAAPGEARHLGRFLVEGEIGSGGMGRVLRLHDQDLGRPLAAKVLHREFERDAASLHKFLVEAQITGQLEHPNIVPVHELGLSDDGLPYIAQRLVEGLTLEVLLALERPEGEAAPGQGALHEALGLGRGLPSTLDQLLEVFCKIADAVSYAHSRGVLHRDLKPENVMVGRFGEVYLMDWGLARLVGADDLAIGKVALDLARRAERDDSALVTLDGTIVGTPAYMPPEQAKGDVARLDERSDVYALGAILYQILARVPPFEGETAWVVLDQVAAGALVPPSQRSTGGPAIPWELEAVVLKAMSPEKPDRYASATELKDEVRAFLEHRPVAAARYSAAQRLGRIARRHTTALRFAAVVAGLLLGAFALLRAGDRRERERELAQRQGALVDEAQGLEAALARASAAVEQLSGPTPATRAAWFRVQSELATASEAVLALGRHPDAPALLGLTLDRARAAHARAVESAALEADRRGEHTAAAAWVARAPLDVRERLTAELARRAAFRADARRAQVERTLAMARELPPDSSRLDALARDVARAAAVGPEAEVPVDELARDEVVALLLAPAHLDAAELAERAVVVRALGLLRGTSGRDVPLALAERLGAEPPPEPAFALELVRALGALGDPRAASALRAFRARQVAGAATWVAALTAECALPLPDAVAAESELEAEERSAVARVRALVDQGRAAEGLALLEPAAEGRSSGSLALARAACLEALGRRAEAFAALETALERAPAAAPAWRELARLCARAGWADAAELAATRACALAPLGAEGWLHRARLRREAGVLDGALADAERALAAGGASGPGRAVKAAILIDLDRRTEAKAELDLAASLDPTSAEIARLQGRLSLAHRNADDAVHALDRALALDRELWIAYGDRARAHALAGNHAAALADWERYLAHFPEDSLAQYDHAVALYAVDRYAEATAALDRALATDARAVAPLMLRARVLAGAGRYEAALADCARVLEVVPGDPDLLLLRASIHLDAGQAALALADLGPILARQPDHVKALYLRAGAHEACGRWEEADRDLGLVLAHNEDLVGARFRRAVVAYARGDRERAMSELARVLAKQPGYHKALARRAAWRHAAGDTARALEDVSEARRHAPRVASYAYDQARYLASRAARAESDREAATARALAALEESLALGHRGGSGFGAEPEWAPFRAQPRYALVVAMARLRGAFGGASR